MSLEQEVNVQGLLYLNEQQPALADVLVLQSLKPSVHQLGALHLIPRTICSCRYVITLPVLGKVRLQVMTKHKHPLLCAVDLSSLRLWLLGVFTKEQVEHQHELKDLPGNLDYRRESPTVQSYIDGSRQKEWKKYEEAGHVPIPSEFVDTVKNIQEKHKPDYIPAFKSRLVSCGNFEDAEGVRTDAPTSDMQTHALVAVFAAYHGVPPFSSNIKNAYFQAMPIDRIVIMRQPQGGLPGVDHEAFWLIRVPVHGLCDSGRGFWKKVDHDAKEVGLISRRICPAFESTAI